MATIASLIVEISAKADKLKQGLAQSMSSITAFAAKAAKALAVIGTLVATAALGAFGILTGMVNRQAEAIDAMAKEAQKVGATVAEFQKLKYGADLAGVSQEQLAQSLKKLNISIGEAASGTGAAKDAFEKLGLSTTALANMNVEERFLAVSDALKDVKDKTLQSSLAVDIFGKSGVDSLVFLNSNIRETSKEFEDLGLTITDQQAAAVEAYNDSKTKLATIWDGFLNQITVAVAPAFQKIIEYIIEFIKQSGGMKGVAENVAKFMISVAEGFITAFETVGKVIDWVRDKISTVAKEVRGVLDRLHLVGNAIVNLSVDPAVIGTLDDIAKSRAMQNPASEGKDFLQQLRNTLNSTSSAFNNKEAANASDFYKDTVIGKIVTDFNKSQEEATKGFDMMAQAAKDNAEKIKTASKSVDDAISALEKSAGQSELTRILGLNDKKGDANPLARSDAFDNLVRKIYQKATTGVQEEFTGTFNGQQVTVGKATTLEEDLKRLTDIMQTTARDGGNVIGMKGALDELTKFVNNKQEQKVKVDINVKADKGFLAEVTTSQELQKAVDDRIKNNAAEEAKKMRG